MVRLIHKAANTYANGNQNWVTTPSGAVLLNGNADGLNSMMLTLATATINLAGHKGSGTARWLDDIRVMAYATGPAASDPWIYGDAQTVVLTTIQNAVTTDPTTLGSPAIGQRWIIPAAAVSAWSGASKLANVATYRGGGLGSNGSWRFDKPITGATAFNVATGLTMTYSGTAWA